MLAILRPSLRPPHQHRSSMMNRAARDGQRYWERDWPAMLENPVIPKNGVVRVPELPGFGMQVKPEVWKHPKAVIRTSER